MTSETARITGSGRTDAGVHAAGQVAHFDTIWSDAPERLQRALNAVMARDVAVLDVARVSGAFHARFDAKARWYCYRIWAAPCRHPLQERFSYHVPFPLDGELMAEEAAGLLGRHDFGCFGAPAVQGGRTEREIRGVTVQRFGALMTIDLVADGFLRHQVRRTVGLLVDIGRGHLPVGSLAAVRDRIEGAPVPRRAPAEGLTLQGVAYAMDGREPSWGTTSIHGSGAAVGAMRSDRSRST